MVETEETYAIIGAGPAGLATARVFARDGIAFEVFERHDDVGGIWDLENPGTPMYATAHFISSKTMSALPDFPMPDGYPDYPSRGQILAYLRDFAKTFDLYPSIRLSTAVDRIEKTSDGWDVTTAGETRRYRGVVLASGSFWEPNLPSYPGTLTVEAYHSRDYRTPDQFRDRRVLVVGGGNSGCDIACDAAFAAASAAISLRRGYRFFPKHIAGRPADVFAHSGPSLPAWIEQPVLGGLVDLVVGKPSQFGLAEPDHKALASHPIMNTQILHHLGHGDLVAKPDVGRLDGDHVVFVDGTRLQVDTVVWATGYRIAFPYLDRDHFTWEQNNPNLYLNVFPRSDDDLFVVGLVETDGGAYPLIGLQAELVSQVIRDQTENPRQAATFRRRKQSSVDLTGGVEHVDSPRHSYYTQTAAYTRITSRLLDELRSGRLSAEEPRPLRRRLTERLRSALPID